MQMLIPRFFTKNFMLKIYVVLLMGSGLCLTFFGFIDVKLGQGRSLFGFVGIALMTCSVLVGGQIKKKDNHNWQELTKEISHEKK